MKIGIFTDPHYCIQQSAPFRALSGEKIKEAFAYFTEQKVDMCICLGDLIDLSDNESDTKTCSTFLSEEIQKCPFPFHLVPGNHDYTVFGADKLAEVMHCKVLPYYEDTPSARFIFLDASYRHNNLRYDQGGVVWTDTNLPPAQIDFLKKSLLTDKECIVCLHELITPFFINKKYIVSPAMKIRRILQESKKVHLVLQGHYHKGHTFVWHKIKYLTVPSLADKNYYTVLDI